MSYGDSGSGTRMGSILEKSRFGLREMVSEKPNGKLKELSGPHANMWSDQNLELNTKCSMAIASSIKPRFGSQEMVSEQQARKMIQV